MSESFSTYLGQSIRWKKTEDVDYPYEGTANQMELKIRLNDFPVESMYTLIVNENPVLNFDDWPESWNRS